MMTAFCSSHDRSRDSGRPFTSVPNTWSGSVDGSMQGELDDWVLLHAVCCMQYDQQRGAGQAQLTSASLEATTMAE